MLQTLRTGKSTGSKFSVAILSLRGGVRRLALRNAGIATLTDPPLSILLSRGSNLVAAVARETLSVMPKKRVMPCGARSKNSQSSDFAVSSGVDKTILSLTTDFLL